MKRQRAHKQMTAQDLVYMYRQSEQGETYSQIAKALNRPTTGIASGLWRFRQFLNGTYQPKGENGPYFQAKTMLENGEYTHKQSTVFIPQPEMTTKTRKSLTGWELAQIYLRIIDQGKTADEVADELTMPYQRVAKAYHRIRSYVYGTYQPVRNASGYKKAKKLIQEAQQGKPVAVTFIESNFSQEVEEAVETVNEQIYAPQPTPSVVASIDAMQTSWTAFQESVSNLADAMLAEKQTLAEENTKLKNQMAELSKTNDDNLEALKTLKHSNWFDTLKGKFNG